MWPISMRVNSPLNDDEEMLNEVDARQQVQ
jgi:hypothetical protein